MFFIGEAAYAQEVLFGLGDEFTVLILNGDSTNRWKTDPPMGIEGAGTLLTNRSFTSSTDSAMADCLAIIEAGLGLEVRSVELLEEGEANYWAATQASCRLFELFRQIATAASFKTTWTGTAQSWSRLCCKSSARLRASHRAARRALLAA